VLGVNVGVDANANANVDIIADDASIDDPRKIWIQQCLR
jgi:hypothetical protein